MKKKTYIKLMTATVLASTLLLGACGNKKETTQASSSAKTSQSSSSKVASASKESKTQKYSNSASSEKTKASTDQSSATATPSQVAPAPEQRQGQEVSNQQAASQQTPAQAPSTQQAPQAQSNQSSYDPTTDRKLQDKQAVLLRQANHQALKQLLLAKKARLRSPQIQLHLKRLRRLLINLQQVRHRHNWHLHQSKDKVKK